MFKVKNNHLPNYLADLFKFPSRKGLRSDYSHFFRIPSNSTHAKSALSYLLWNSLLPNLTSVTSLLSFCKTLETVV